MTLPSDKRGERLLGGRMMEAIEYGGKIYIHEPDVRLAVDAALATRPYDAIADAVNEIADAAREAFTAAGFDPGEWDGDNIVQDVKRGLVNAIERLSTPSHALQNAPAGSASVLIPEGTQDERIDAAVDASQNAAPQAIASGTVQEPSWPANAAPTPMVRVFTDCDERGEPQDFECVLVEDYRLLERKLADEKAQHEACRLPDERSAEIVRLRNEVADLVYRSDLCDFPACEKSAPSTTRLFFDENIVALARRCGWGEVQSRPLECFLEDAVKALETTASATPCIDPRMLMLIRVLDDLEDSGNGWNPATLPNRANEAERKFRDMLVTNWREIRRLIPIRRTDGTTKEKTNG